LIKSQPYACLLMISILVVKASGDSVGASEAPHADDLLGPGVERVAERDELRQLGVAKIDDGPEETRNQLLALAASLVFLPQS
jgi:hypothetical protein